MKYSWSRVRARSISVSVSATVCVPAATAVAAMCPFLRARGLPFRRLIRRPVPGGGPRIIGVHPFSRPARKKRLNRERWRVLVQRERGFLSAPAVAGYQRRSDGLSIDFREHAPLNRKSSVHFAKRDEEKWKQNRGVALHLIICNCICSLETKSRGQKKGIVQRVLFFLNRARIKQTNETPECRLRK